MKRALDQDTNEPSPSQADKVPKVSVEKEKNEEDVHEYGKDPNHPATDDCSDASCMECGARDCAFNDPLHYHHDACPSCYIAEKRGKIETDKLPGRFAKGPDDAPMKWPSKEGYFRVNVCSSGQGKWKQLSPMLLGPIKLDELGGDWTKDAGESLRVPLPKKIQNIENLWQYTKVWEGDEDPKTQLPSNLYFIRRNLGWNKKQADRYPLKYPLQAKGKNNPPFKNKGPNKSIPLYSYWFGEKLSYLEGRRRIYCPIYERLVRKTEAYKDLEARVERGENILIIGYDGYPREGKTWKQCFEDISRPFGHEMVIACMLENRRPFPWEEQK